MIVIFVLGLIIGLIAHGKSSSDEPVGSLRIDTSDPDEGPYLFLELKNDPEEVMNKKYITLKVDIKNYISQK
jgi:hypothetical protein